MSLNPVAAAESPQLQIARRSESETIPRKNSSEKYELRSTFSTSLEQRSSFLFRKWSGNSHKESDCKRHSLKVTLEDSPGRNAKEGEIDRLFSLMETQPSSPSKRASTPHPRRPTSRLSKEETPQEPNLATSPPRETIDRFSEEEKEEISQASDLIRRKTPPLSLSSISSSETEIVEPELTLSPRAEVKEIDLTALQIKGFLGEEFPPLLFQILAQAIHNQYAYLSKNGYVLILGMEQEGLLTLFLQAVAKMILSKSFICKLSLRRLIELALRVLANPLTQATIESGEVKGSILVILKAGESHLKHSSFQELIERAEEATLLHEKRLVSSKKTAEKGLCSFRLIIYNPEEMKHFEDIQTNVSEEDPLNLQKTFLFAVYFFLLETNRLQLDKEEKKPLIQLSLNIFLSSEGDELLRIPKIRNIAESILKSDVLESSDPEIRQMLRWVKVQLDRPSGSQTRCGSSRELAQEGLSSLSRSIRDPEDLVFFEKIKNENQNDLLSTQKTFLCSLSFFLLKKNRLRLSELQQESFVQQSLKIFLSPEGKKLLCNIKIKEIAEKILSLPFANFAYPDTSQLINEAKTCILQPLISLNKLQFLLFWIQSPRLKEKELLDLVAGTREWDPHGNLYLFVSARCLDLLQEVNEDTDVLTRLVQFLFYWRQAPANQDLLMSRPFLISWEKLRSQLTNKLPEMRSLDSSLLSQRKKIGILKKRSKELDDVLCRPFSIALKEKSFACEQGSPDRGSSDLAFSSPIPQAILSLWEEEFAAEIFENSVVFHLLMAKQQVLVKDLSLIATMKTENLSNQSKSFNQVTQLFAIEILAARKRLEAVLIVRILCRVQRKLLKHSAFEAALAIHAVFQLASITRLKRAFMKEEFFFDLFESPEAVCQQQKNARQLRELQQHPGSISATNLLRKDLEFFRMIPFRFTEEGKVDLDRLQEFGRIYNRFVQGTEDALTYWIDERNMTPNLSILKALSSQSGQLDEQEDILYARSEEIHPLDSDSFWGEKLVF